MHAYKEQGSRYPAIPSHLIVTGGHGIRKVVRVEERDVSVPLIDLSLKSVYRLGGLIDAGPIHGTQMEARLSYQWDFGVRDLVGAAVPVDLDEPLIVVPLGFFARAH